MKSLATDYQLRHHFVVAYSPWSKGTVEVVHKHVLAECRALSTEMSVGTHD